MLGVEYKLGVELGIWEVTPWENNLWKLPPRKKPFGKYLT